MKQAESCKLCYFIPIPRKHDNRIPWGYFLQIKRADEVIPYSSVLEINPKALKASNTASSFLLFNLGTILAAPGSSLSAPHLSRTEQTLDLLISSPYDFLTHFLTPPIDS